MSETTIYMGGTNLKIANDVRKSNIVYKHCCLKDLKVFHLVAQCSLH